MPAASATSSTLTSSNPRAVKRSIASLLMCSQLVDRRRPTRCGESGCTSAPFPGPAFILALDAILLRSRSQFVEILSRKGADSGAESDSRDLGRRARHRDTGRRGVDRRDVRGLLIVTSSAAETGTDIAFDPDLSWRLHPQV